MTSALCDDVTGDVKVWRYCQAEALAYWLTLSRTRKCSSSNHLNCKKPNNLIPFWTYVDPPAFTYLDYFENITISPNFSVQLSQQHWFCSL